MRRKFSLMWRVAIALVLALSLSLVMAAPVSALTVPDVTVDPTTVEATAQYTIVFTTTSDLTTASVDTITVEFPSDTVVPETYATGDITVNTYDVVTATGSNRVVTITVPQNVPIGVVTVVFTTAAGIENPSTAATDYTLDVSTSEEVAVTSGEYTITAIVDSTDPTVAVTAPNGGQNWAAGSTQSITWTADDLIDTALTIKLEYYNGSSWTDITTLADTSLTAYSWTVPSVDSTECKVRVTATDDADNSASDISDAVFTIDSTLPAVVVTAPNGGEVWVAGSAHNITWTCTDTDLAATPIDIDYSTDGGTTWASVATGEDNDGTSAWTLPAVYSATCLVKVTATDAIGNSGSDESNAVFTIDDTADPTGVAVTAPDGAETWAVGSTQSITWGTVSDNVDTATTIKLEYSADAGSSWTEITTLADYTVVLPATSPSYSWVIPSIDSANCLVKITATDDADNSASDASDAVFTIAAATEVWVGPNGLDTYPGTEAMPFLTIDAGITAAGVDGTVNVLPGIYVLGSNATLTIETAGLTLQSTGGAAVTIIDATAVDGGAPDDGSGIYINAAGVTVDGFTIEDPNACGIYVGDVDDAIIENNVITMLTSDKGGIDVHPGATGVKILSNILNEYATIAMHGSDIEISGNSLGNCINLWALGPIEGVTITDNTFPAATHACNGAINFKADVTATISGVLIEGNDLSNRDMAGIRIGSGTASNLTVTNLTITGNDITNNLEAGIKIYDIDSWGTGNTIINNNITGNVVYGITNADAAIIDAENNWWGDDSGPYNVTTNATGTGEAVSDDVDYRPWLLAPYAEPADPVTSIDLVAGWNFISVPKRMAAATDTFGELLDGISVEVAYSYDPVSGWSAAKVDADPVEVLEGYWVDVNTAGTVTLSYKEAAQEVPASKSLVGDAWNAIGFSSTTARDANTALMSVDGSWSTVLEWDAEGQAYEDSIIVGTAGAMLPGKGYWIWMTEDDVLSAISG